MNASEHVWTIACQIQFPSGWTYRWKMEYPALFPFGLLVQ